MYQIMIRVNNAGDLTKNTYQFLPELDTTTKQYHVYQAETKEAVMEKAKELLNSGKYDYGKYDFLVVEHIKFNVTPTIITEADIIPPNTIEDEDEDDSSTSSATDGTESSDDDSTSSTT